MAVDGSIVTRFLDDLRAAEAAGAEVLNAWVAVCRLDGLRGGLRTIGEREAGHAELLAERLRELAAPCTAEVEQRVRQAAFARYGSATVSDEDKLRVLLARYPDDLSMTRPIYVVLNDMRPDPETSELLRLVADGEAATIAWLRGYAAELARRGVHVLPDRPRA